MNIKGILFISFVLLVFSLASVSASDFGHVAVSDSHSGSSIAHVPVTVSSHDDSVVVDDFKDFAVDDSSIDDGESVPVDDGSSIDGDGPINVNPNDDVNGDINDSDSIIINITNDTCPSYVDDNPISNIKEESESFDDLQSLVDLAPSGTILCLCRDYKGSEDKQITVNKNLVIDGQGHTLDGNGECRIFYSTKGDIVLKNLKLINGYVNGWNPVVYSYRGGAIYIVSAAKYTIENCQFINNWADDYGGAITNGVSQLLTIKNCTFNSNTADDCSGGAIYSKGNLLIEDSTFKGNTAYKYGGAIYLNIGSNFNIINCCFESNQGEYGGAIHSEHPSLDIVNSTFKDNFAKASGGAIYARDKAVFTHCLFSSNTCDGGILELNCGGAIYGETNMDVYDCIFNDNCAVNDGGAIYCVGDLTVQNSNFTSNRATDSKLKCYGGAIRSFCVQLVNCIFTKNYSENHGGAIFTDTTAPEIKDCKFIDNKADEDGGAVYINNENTVTFKQCSFINNCAGDEGGVIYLDSKSAHIILNNNLFSGNIANNGKAVYNYGFYDGVSSNWWGSENPSYRNYMLVEWHFLKNEYHTDSNPLTLAVVSLDRVVKVGKLYNVTVLFRNTDGTEFSDGVMPVEDINFTLPVGIKEFSTDYLDNIVVLSYVAENVGSYDVGVGLFDQNQSIRIVVEDALSSTFCRDNVNGSHIVDAFPIDNGVFSVVSGLKSVVHPQFDGDFDIVAAFLSLLSVVGL